MSDKSKNDKSKPRTQTTFASLRTKIPLILLLTSIPLFFMLTIVPSYVYIGSTKLNNNLKLNTNLLGASYSALTEVQAIYANTLDCFHTPASCSKKVSNTRDLIAKVHMYLDLLSWGENSAGFKAASKGESYKQWMKWPPDKRVKIGVPTQALQKAGALTHTYFDVFIKYIQAANHISSTEFRKNDKNKLPNAATYNLLKAMHFHKLAVNELNNIFYAAQTRSEQTRLQIRTAQKNIIILIVSSMIFLFLLNFIVMWLVIGVSLVGPLQALKAKIIQLGQGHFNGGMKVEANDEIGMVAQQFNRLSNDLEKMTVSRDYLNNIIKSMSNMLIVTDAKGIIELVNQPLLELLKFDLKDLLQQSVNMLFDPNAKKNSRTILPQLKELFKNKYFFNVEMHIYSKEHHELPVWISGSVMYDKKGEIQRIIMTAQDMSISKLAQEQGLQLREIHHRLRNNMQIISSFLQLQARQFSGEQKQAFIECQNRIRALSMVHEKLYLIKEYSTIQIDDYIKTLVDTLIKTYSMTNLIKTHFDIAPIKIKADYAAPLGIIVNELVTNMIQHAFLESHKNPEISVVLKQPSEGSYELLVADNGKGINEDFDLHKPNSVGMLLVSTLAEQIGGSLEIKVNHGTTFKVRFKSNL